MSRWWPHPPPRQPPSLPSLARCTTTRGSFNSSNGDISSRTKTTAFVAWNNVASWTSGQTYQSANITQILQELVNRSGWDTGSNVNILIRSDDLAGNRVVHSYNGSQANAPSLHVEYTMSTASTTPTTDRLYVEQFTYRMASSASSWQTVDLSVTPFKVPANKVVEIAIVNVDANNEHWGGVRAVGSALERRFQLHEADSGGLDVVVMQVQTDAIPKFKFMPTAQLQSLLWCWGIGPRAATPRKCRALQSPTLHPGKTATWAHTAWGPTRSPRW